MLVGDGSRVFLGTQRDQLDEVCVCVEDPRVTVGSVDVVMRSDLSELTTVASRPLVKESGGFFGKVLME